jgi:hypothetical protein
MSAAMTLSLLPSELQREISAPAQPARCSSWSQASPARTSIRHSQKMVVVQRRMRADYQIVTFGP